MVVARPAWHHPAGRTAREPVAAALVSAVRDDGRRRVRAGRPGLCRPEPASRLDRRRVRRRLRGAAPARLGPQRRDLGDRSRRETASSSAASTAWPSAVSSRPSRSSIVGAMRRRPPWWRWSTSCVREVRRCSTCSGRRPTSSRWVPSTSRGRTTSSASPLRSSNQRSRTLDGLTSGVASAGWKPCRCTSIRVAARPAGRSRSCTIVASSSTSSSTSSNTPAGPISSASSTRSLIRRAAWSARTSASPSSDSTRPTIRPRSRWSRCCSSIPSSWSDPVVFRGDRAVIARPSEKVLELLD